ncbi:MAG: hypothetical protein J1E03_12110 [Acetatifactor sp.]|nr:hypothetical protein [Acetatifactor sp.]
MKKITEIFNNLYSAYQSIITSGNNAYYNQKRCIELLEPITTKVLAEANDHIDTCEKMLNENNDKQVMLLDRRAELFSQIESGKKQLSQLDAQRMKILTEIASLEEEINREKSLIVRLQQVIVKRESERKYWEKVWWATCWIPFANIGTGAKTIHENDSYSILAEQSRRKITDNERRICKCNSDLEKIRIEQKKYNESSGNLANKITALNGEISLVAQQINSLKADLSVCQRVLASCLRISTELSYINGDINKVFELIRALVNTMDKIIYINATDKYIKGCICKGDRLCVGQKLSQNEYLLSENRRFVAVMQSDNNFVLYNSNKPLWASRTYGTRGKGYIELGGNGIVSLNGTSGCWNTKRDGISVLIMQNDGNLVAYTKDNKPVWATDTYTYANVPSICFKNKT